MFKLFYSFSSNNKDFLTKPILIKIKIDSLIYPLRYTRLNIFLFFVVVSKASIYLLFIYLFIYLLFINKHSFYCLNYLLVN